MPVRLHSVPELGRTEIHVWCTELDGWDEDATRALGHLLSYDEEVRSNRFVFEQDRTRFIVARGLLRLLLAAQTGREPKEIRLEYGQNGKPYLKPGRSRSLSFNLSHSRGLAVIAIARSRELGADVEFLRDLLNLEGVAAQCCRAREYAAIIQLPSAERRRAFFRCWSRKEAFVKATGRGLATLLTSVEVWPERKGPISIIDQQTSKFGQTVWMVHDIDVHDGFSAAVAVASRDMFCTVLRLSRADLSIDPDRALRRLGGAKRIVRHDIRN